MRLTKKQQENAENERLNPSLWQMLSNWRLGLTLETIENLLSVLARPFLFLIYGVSGWFPRQRNCWVYGSWNGKRYADNSAALFEFAQSIHSPFRHIWITRDRQIVRQLRKRGYEAYHFASPTGLWTCLRAGVYIFDGHTKDINHWLSRTAFLVHLQHGPGGFKNIERNIRDLSHPMGVQFHGNDIQRLIWYLLRPWHSAPLSLVITASEQQYQEARSAYGVNKHQIAITGLPRNDVFAAYPSTSKIAPELKNWIDEGRRAGDKIIVHTPTFRDHGVNPFVGFWDQYEPILERLEIRCIAHQHYVGGHQSQLKNVSNGGRIWYLDAVTDAHPILPLTDAMVTDFCSISFDYLLLNKPLIYFIPDYHEYLHHCRSLRFSFSDMSSGPLIFGESGLTSALENIPGNLALPENQSLLRQYFHQFDDGRNSERVFGEIYRRIQH